MYDTKFFFASIITFYAFFYLLVNGNFIPNTLLLKSNKTLYNLGSFKQICTQYERYEHGQGQGQNLDEMISQICCEKIAKFSSRVELQYFHTVGLLIIDGN